jgi:hypothetical protein
MGRRGDHDGVTTEEIQHVLELQPGDIEVAEVLLVLRQLVGVIALETGETPRTLLDDEFTKAPSDEFWRATIGATL